MDKSFIASVCECGIANIIYYCSNQPKCKNQAYYCAECAETHQHAPKSINKAINEQRFKWDQRKDEFIMKINAIDASYTQYQEIIQICEKQQKELKISSNISTKKAQISYQLEEWNKNIQVFISEYEIVRLLEYLEKIEQSILNNLSTLDQCIITKEYLLKSCSNALKSSIFFSSISEDSQQLIYELKKEIAVKDTEVLYTNLGSQSKEIMQISQQLNDVLEYKMNVLSQQLVLRDDKISKMESEIEKSQSLNQKLTTQLSKAQVEISQLKQNYCQLRQFILSKIPQFDQKTSFKVLHILPYQKYDISPSTQLLQDAAKKLNLQIQVTERVQESGIEELNIDDFDSVLVSAQSNDTIKVGNFLVKCISNKKTVVQIAPSTWKNPTGEYKGAFDTPNGSYDQNHQGVMVTNPQHQIFKDYQGIQKGSSTLRAISRIAKQGDIEVLANWADGHPCIAVRKDLDGLIFNFSYISGSTGSTNGLLPIVNALSLFRQEFQI